jgi:hypothetical protein
LTKEAAGRRLAEGDSMQRTASHETIGAAIESARMGFEAGTRLAWHISRDSHYQISNRFAWSWKLTQLGIPVVLVYLGFLNASDMPMPMPGMPWSGRIVRRCFPPRYGIEAGR